MVESMLASISARVSLSETLNVYRCTAEYGLWIPMQGEKRKDTFCVGSIKYHFIFMKVTPGLYTGNLFSASVVMECLLGRSHSMHG